MNVASESKMVDTGASQYVHLNEHYYAILSMYNEEVYVHLHNKYKKRKRFSLKFDDMRTILCKGDVFEKALDKLYTEDREGKEELEDGDDDDMAYHQISDPTFKAPLKKRPKPAAETNKRTR